MLLTIQDFEHHLQTTFGNLESALYNADGDPFQGMCQGKGAVSTILVAISTPLFDMMRSAAMEYSLQHHYLI